MPLERLTPQFFEKVWGSERLEPWFPSTGAKIGEVWFDGPDHPILIKFLFTSGKLSVQVHPDDAYAAQHHPTNLGKASRGKTEMWHVLAAEPGAQIAAGLRETISEERLRAAALSGEIEQLLEWHDACPGDTFFIPAGTVHAIGEGLVLCEIQQRSDITYRLYDYGRPRELHLDQSLAVSRREPHPARVKSTGEELVSCDHFVVRRRIVNGTSQFTPSPGRMNWLIVLDGEGRIAGTEVRGGEVWYAPKGTTPFEVSGHFTLLWASAA